MPRKTLETVELDQVMSMLLENSGDLRIILNEVNKISDRVTDVCELSSLKKVEEKMIHLEDLIGALSEKFNEAQKHSPAGTANSESGKSEAGDSTIVSECKSWRDFQEFASGAQTIHISYQTENRFFEAEALKGNTLNTFSGEEPMLSSLLKLWLRGYLETQEKDEWLENSSN